MVWKIEIIAAIGSQTSIFFYPTIKMDISLIYNSKVVSERIILLEFSLYKTGDKSALHGVFVVKRVLNQIWNWLIVFRCKLELTQMVFVMTSIVWPMEYST